MSKITREMLTTPMTNFNQERFERPMSAEEKARIEAAVKAVAASDPTPPRLEPECQAPAGLDGQLPPFKPCVIVLDEAGMTEAVFEDVPYVTKPVFDGVYHYMDEMLALDDGRLVGFSVWQTKPLTRANPPTEPVAYTDPKIVLLLKIVEATGGNIDASDYDNNALNYFCEDRGKGDDTFNLAIKAKYLRIEHDSRFDASTAFLTESGRAITGSRVNMSGTDFLPTEEINLISAALATPMPEGDFVLVPREKVANIIYHATSSIGMGRAMEIADLIFAAAPNPKAKS